MDVWILDKKENWKKYENKRFLETALKMGIEAKLVAPPDFEIIVTKEDEKGIFYRGKAAKLPDCLIPRMGAETTYFALAIIRQMSRMGVFVLNSDSSISAAKDKLSSMQILSANKLPIPKTMLAKFPLDKKIIKKEFEYPIVIKTVSGSEGRGVFLCENQDQMEDLLALLEESKDQKTNIILQEFVASSVGKDIRIITVGGRPIGAMLRIAKNGSFKANYSAGGSVAPFKITKAAEWLCVESAGLLDLEVAGVDLLFDGDHYKVCEVNSAPGFVGFEKATGIDVPKHIFEFLKVRLQVETKI